MLTGWWCGWYCLSSRTIRKHRDKPSYQSNWSLCSHSAKYFTPITHILLLRQH